MNLKAKRRVVVDGHSPFGYPIFHLEDADMAIDPENHIIDPVTGFAVHKVTGHRIGLDNVPDVPAEHADFPKWVKPHPSHVIMLGDQVSTPGWAQHHVERGSGVVIVLVADEREEKAALAPRKGDDE